MESNDPKIAVLEGELSRLLGWIQTAETKVSLVLAISTALLGALAVLSPVCSGWCEGWCEWGRAKLSD